MRRTRLAACLVASLVLSTGLGVAFVPVVLPDAAAQDKDKDKDKKKDAERERKEKERKARERAIKGYAENFAAKDVTSLLAQVRKGSKVRLTLPQDTDNDFAVQQARDVLDKYLEHFEVIRVDVSKGAIEKDVGSFTLTMRRNGEDKTQKRTLWVRVGGGDGDYFLVSLTVGT